MARWCGLLVVVCGVACGPTARGPKPAAMAAHPQDEASAGPVYRFVPETAGTRLVQVDATHVGGLEGAGEARVVVGADGALERAVTPGGELMSGGAVPEHLGGGFVFWTSDALYRARTFAGPLEPIAALEGNAIGVEFGPSSLLLFTPQAPPHAYALEPGRPVPLSPHGALEMGAADAERALAFDAVGRALATVDGGRSWQDMKAALGETAYGIATEGHEVGFVLADKVGAWLQKDGGFARRVLASAKGEVRERTVLERFKFAVAQGLPLSGTRALAVDERGISEVELVSGEATVSVPKVPWGNRCAPLSLAEGGLFRCFGNDGPLDTAIVSRARSEHPEVEKRFEHEVTMAIGDEQLVMRASCAGKWEKGVACVRSAGRAADRATGQAGTAASWAEVTIQAAIGDKWDVRYWVPKAKGGVAAIVSESRGTRESRRLALVDAASGGVTVFDAPTERIAPADFNRDATRTFVVREDGTLRGFTATSALSVDAKGHVAVPAKTFKSLASSGAFALADDGNSRLWQTKDYGDHWVEVARPPFESEHPPQPIQSRFMGTTARSTTCSAVGCVIRHESGLGDWVRVGWPVDPPRAREAAKGAGGRAGASAGQGETGAALVVPAPRPKPARAKLTCTVTSAASKPGRPLLTLGAEPAGAAKTGTAKTGTAQARTAKTSTNLQYGDAFLQDTLMTYGSRAVVRLGGTPGSGALEQLAEKKTPFEVQVVEPFDPAGHTLRGAGSLAAWTRFLKARTPKEKEQFLGLRRSGSARPVLAAAPGRADGALLVDQDFSFWLSHTGKVLPLRPGCRADSGYVDARGTLFVACGARSGETTLWDTGRELPVLKVPLTERFRFESGPGMSFFAPGAQLLTNTDAVAVGPNGKLAILRAASGSEPPTVDVPAWLLTADGPPVELAPWATLELATSPACAKGDGYRALIQTLPPWIDVAGARASSDALGMSAIVRWSTERVCLEAVEIGAEPSAPIQANWVARFTGKGENAAFVGTSATASLRENATCELVAP
ncbi:MAG TPA: hypothetical protein VFV94_20240 [Polyangiaceae bacterium]|nr:hypothetical protein [Polyangiaceae bacterium]